MQYLLLATHNLHKQAEIGQILGKIPFKILSLKDFPELKPVEETGSSFEENALLKARAAFCATGFQTIAEDSGLEIDALGGQPGIYSARYAGEKASDLENIQRVLKELRDLKKEASAIYPARFLCVAVWIDKKGSEKIYKGVLEGEITTTPRGDSGFGYDPIFWLPELQKTLAEIDSKQKNALSHRARAFLKLKESLAKCFSVVSPHLFSSE